MAEIIGDGRGNISGNSFLAGVSSDNYLLVVGSIISQPAIAISGTPTFQVSGGIHIGSVSANVDSIYIQSGGNIIGSMGITTNPLPVSGNIELIDDQTRQIGTLPFSFGSAFFSATGSILETNISSNPFKAWAIQVVGSNGTPTSWDVRIEGTLFTSGFTTILQHTNTDGDGITKFSSANLYPALYYRTRVAGLVLGVGPVGLWAHVLGVA